MLVYREQETRSVFIVTVTSRTNFCSKFKFTTIYITKLIVSDKLKRILIRGHPYDVTVLGRGGQRSVKRY
jgi:hypothetical protein